MKMLITCSDARVIPENLLPNSRGDLFIMRNAGNIVPHADRDNHGSEAATIELAIEALGIRDIIVCGHSDCGAMKALMNDDNLSPSHLPVLHSWLSHAQKTKEIIENHCPSMCHQERLDRAIETNVLVQLSNIGSHPSVAKKIKTGDIRLHAWVYDIASNKIRDCSQRSMASSASA